MSLLRRIREYYGVPVRRGARVKYKGTLATITSATTGHRIRLRFDGHKRRHPGVFHPTWEIEYL